MNFKKQNGHMVDILFVIALFCVFAISALMLVTIGARVYQSTVENMDVNYTSRTSYAYLTEKFRQNDIYDSISIGEFGDSEALILSQSIDEVTYHTYLYLYDGYLTELFTKANSTVGLDAGQKILPLNDFILEESKEGLFEFRLVNENDVETILYLSSHCN